MYPVIGHGQSVERMSIDQVIAGAAEQRRLYINEFRNLLSQETKTFEIYDKKGFIKKRRSVISTFIVYQLSKNDQAIAEYRSVLSVDGKNVEDADKRAENFFERISTAESSNKELERLENEGSRYDQNISVNGFTLFQAAPLAENIRSSMEFRLLREDVISGNTVYVISYTQTRQSPYIITEKQPVVGDGKLTLIYETGVDDKAAAVRLNGEFWIDAATLQVRREIRNLTVLPEGWSTPVTAGATVFEYEASDFGILVPKRIEHTTFEIKKKERSALKDSKITFTYDKFTRPDVDVKSSEVK